MDDLIPMCEICEKETWDISQDERDGIFKCDECMETGRKYKDSNKGTKNNSIPHIAYLCEEVSEECRYYETSKWGDGFCKWYVLADCHSSIKDTQGLCVGFCINKEANRESRYDTKEFKEIKL